MNRQLQMIFDRAAVGIALIDAMSGRLLQANRFFWKYLGSSPLELRDGAFDEVLVENIMAVIHPEDRKARDAVLKRLLKGEIDTFSLDMRYQRKDGSWFWFNSTVTPTWEPGSPPTEYVAVLQDINQRKRLERSLIRSEDLLSSTLDSLSEAVFVVNPANRQIEVCNKAACEMFGYSKSDLLNSNTLKLHVDQEYFKEFARRSEAAMESENAFVGEFVMRRASGEIFPTEHEVHSISLRYGWKDGVVSVIRDISERKEKEQELLKLSQALEQSPVGIVLIDLEGRIEYVNKKYTELTGFSRDEVVGRLGGQVNEEDALCGLGERLLQVENRHAEWQGRVPCPRHQSGSFLAQATLSPILGNDEQCSNYLLTLIDITEKQALQKASEQASRLAAVGTLAAGVAHEINNPNSVIMHNLQTLQAVWNDLLPILDEQSELRERFSLGGIIYPDQGDELRQMLDDCLGSSERIKRIVADLKNFSAAEAVAPEEDPLSEMVDLNEVVRTASRLSGSIIKTSTDHYSVELEPGLPMVRGNFLRLEQVVVNLLINACQALSSRQQAVWVKTHFDPEAQLNWIEVYDQGEGIPEKYQQQILEPFFTTRRADGGSGLGLSISSTILSEHGGKIVVDSKVGSATCVSFALPVLAEEVES